MWMMLCFLKGCWSVAFKGGIRFIMFALCRFLGCSSILRSLHPLDPVGEISLLAPLPHPARQRQSRKFRKQGMMQGMMQAMECFC